jgi:uncharacterized protein (DUF58 family)
VAIQTTSNSTLLLAFVMLALMLLAMFLTHDTLQGLALRCGEPAPSFAAESATYPLLIETRHRRPPLRLRFRKAPESAFVQLSAGITLVGLSWKPEQRGWQQPPQLQIETIAPLGLFICWTRWHPPTQQLIWPRRRPGPVQEKHPPRWRDGLDEWQDLRPVREGERPAVVDWAGVAKGRPLQAKVFSVPEDVDRILEPAPGVSTEQAMEHLADRIWTLQKRGERYGLHLPSTSLPPMRGLQHRNACLEALATE